MQLLEGLDCWWFNIRDRSIRDESRADDHLPGSHSAQTGDLLRSRTGGYELSRRKSPPRKENLKPRFPAFPGPYLAGGTRSPQ